MTIGESSTVKVKLRSGNSDVLAKSRPTEYAVYEIHGAPVALAVLASESGDEDGMQEVRSAGGEHWVDRCKGHTVVTCRRDKLAYAAVSREASEAQLVSLMTGGIHESN